MASTRCSPQALLIPGGFDSLADPPPALSTGSGHAQQADWLSRHRPGDYFPSSVTGACLVESARQPPQLPRTCIATAALDNELVVTAAAGPGRDLLATTTCPVLDDNNNNSSRNDGGFHHSSLVRRWTYAQASGPILEININNRVMRGWERILKQPNMPMLAARGAHTVDFFQLKKAVVPASDSSTSWTLQGSVRDTRGDRTNSSGQPPHVGQYLSEFVDVAWCRQLPQRAAVLCSDGVVLDVAVEPGRGELAAPVAWRPPLDFRNDPSSGDRSRLRPSPRTAFTAVHPRQLLVHSGHTLGLADLRDGQGFMRFFRVAAGDWMTAIAAAPGDEAFSSQPQGAASPAPSGSTSYSQYLFAVASARSVMLFDLRRPHSPLASWTHEMSTGRASVGGKPPEDVDAFLALPPDSLIWLPEIPPIATTTDENGSMDSIRGDLSKMGPLGRILAFNSRSGYGIVCEWGSQRGRGGLVAKEGALWEVKIDQASALVASGEADFGFEPAGWTQVTAVTPPLLVWDITGAKYPAPLVEVMERGRVIQRRRAAAREIHPNGGDHPAAIHGHQQASGRRERSSFSATTRLLPSSKWQPPPTLGVSIVCQDWLSHTTLPTPQAMFLGGTQEITVAALHSGWCLGPVHFGSAKVPVVVASESDAWLTVSAHEERRQGTGGEVPLAQAGTLEDDPQQTLLRTAVAQGPLPGYRQPEFHIKQRKQNLL